MHDPVYLMNNRVIHSLKRDDAPVQGLQINIERNINIKALCSGHGDDDGDLHDTHHGGIDIIHMIVCMFCRFTEADLRLFPTIIRFDAVYAGLFKCGKRRISDYPHLAAWMRDVYQINLPGGGLQVGAGTGVLL